MPFLEDSQPCRDRLEGRIMMLPKKSEIEDMIPETPVLDDGIFNHPVIVLCRKVHRDKVAVFVVTSFGDTPIDTRHAHPSRRQRYLPISPASHPDTDRILTVAHGKTMKKQSYVKIRDVYEIPYAALRPYWQQRDLHLQTESYNTLTTCLFEQNVAQLAANLREYGISNQPLQSAPIRQPALVSHHGIRSGVRLDGPHYGATYAGMLASPPPPPKYTPPASYGTYPGGLTSTNPQYAPITRSSKSTTPFLHVQGAYHGYQTVSTRPGTMAASRALYSAASQADSKDRNEGLGDLLGILVLVIIIGLSVWGFSKWKH